MPFDFTPPRQQPSDPLLRRVAELEAALERVTAQRDEARREAAEALRHIEAGVLGEAIRHVRRAAQGEAGALVRNLRDTLSTVADCDGNCANCRDLARLALEGRFGDDD